jgi:hypothetical protein
MPSHPFVYPYVGLGLLKEESIRQAGDRSHADYLDESGAPYLCALVAENETKLTEYDADGKEMTTTVASTLNDAIVRYGVATHRLLPSPFWLRLFLRDGRAWTRISQFVAPTIYVPAVAMATLRIPVAPSRPWRTPPPTALAQTLGLADRISFTPRPARLFRQWRGREPEVEKIEIREATFPAILLPGIIGAVLEAMGMTPAIEWRPYVEPDPSVDLLKRWLVSGKSGDRPEGILESFTIALEA